MIVFTIALVTEYLEGKGGKISMHDLEAPKLGIDLLANVPVIFLAFGF